MRAVIFIVDSAKICTDSGKGYTCLSIEDENSELTIHMRDGHATEDLRRISIACEEEIANLEAQHESGSS